MKKKVIRIVILLVFAGLFAGGYGYYMYQKPVKNFSESKAEITITAKAIFDEFAANQNAAEAKYVAKDKTIQVSGKIARIEKKDDGTYTVYLEVGTPDSEVSCSFAPEASQKAAGLKAGMNVAIKGQCTGWQDLISREVVMIRCGMAE
ncbi:MAG: hypothetical protein HW421_4098 [Ignavibacteria bacterium]|nr:hypothetical protein [Ignavibacteria bacterium]